MWKAAVGLLLITGIQAENLYELNIQEVQYRTQKFWDKDASVLQQIIGIWSSRIGADSLGIAQYDSKLGTALMNTGQNAAAEPVLRSALSILEANGALYGEAAIVVKRKLVRDLLRQGKTDDAYTLKNSLPPLHPPEKSDTGPQLISKREADYTKQAGAKAVSGSILISLTVDESGHPRDVRVIEPLGFALDENAIKAVQAWSFNPAMRGGTPVSSSVQVEVNFRKF